MPTPTRPHRTIMSFGFSLLCACSQGSDTSDTWVGRDVTDLRQVWGQPTEERVQQDGVALVYVSYWRDGIFGNHRCQKTFAANTKGVITSYTSVDC